MRNCTCPYPYPYPYPDPCSSTQSYRDSKSCQLAQTQLLAF